MIAQRPAWWRVVRAFAPDWWQHRRLLAVSYVCSLAAVGTLVLAPWPLKILIDSVLGTHPLPGPLALHAAALSPTGQIVVLAAAVALIAAMRSVFSTIEKYVNARIRESMVLKLRDRLLGHVQTLPSTLGTDERSGEIVLRLVDDVRMVTRLFSATAPLLFRHLAALVITFAAMFWLEPRLGLLGLAIVSILAWLIRGYADSLREASQHKRRREGDVAGLAQEIIRGLPSVQVMGAEGWTRERFEHANAQSLDAGVHEARIAARMERVVTIVSGLAVALVIGAGGLLVLAGDMTIGGLIVGAAYITQLLRPVAKINELGSAVTRGLARGDQLLALLDRTPCIRDRSDAVDIERARGRVELRDVSFAYAPDLRGQAEAPVLRDVNLCLEPGKLTVLVGPSGSGKSTLVALLLRLFEPSSGTILLDGMPYPRIRLQSLRAQFAVMLQETHLFKGSLRDALRPLDREVSDAELWEALGHVVLDDFARTLPGGLDAHLGEAGMNLSGGQRARLSLARALLLDCPILVLDEPLANVDPESQRIIVNALDRVRHDRTCLAVTHQSALVEQADVIARLDGQRITTQPGRPRTPEPHRELVR